MAAAYFFAGEAKKRHSGQRDGASDVPAMSYPGCAGTPKTIKKGLPCDNPFQLN